MIPQPVAKTAVAVDPQGCVQAFVVQHNCHLDWPLALAAVELFVGGRPGHIQVSGRNTEGQ